jgi:hypothetical protein
MPVPIMPVKKSNEPKSTGLDYSILLNYQPPKSKTVVASNKDASLLFDLWSKSEKNNDDIIKVDYKVMSSQDILRLKSLGFIQGDTEKVKFTKKGKILITTMTLAEESQFDKKRQNKSYTEILASMSLKNKSGYRIPKFASDNNNHLDLRK